MIFMENVDEGAKSQEEESLKYRVSHITGPTLFLLFSRVLEHIQRNFS